MEFEGAFVKDPPFPNNYANEILVLDRGEGCYVFDIKDKKYLDFGSGISVNALGYGRKDLAEVASRQMEKLVHVSNLYTTKPAIKVAAKLTALGNFSAVHFGSSGSEANEAALKYARLYSSRVKGEGNYKLASFTTAFHGRTMGSLSVTPTEKYKKPFEPLIPGVELLRFNNIEDLKQLDSTFAGVIVEPIQGEGGLEPMTQEFAKELNRVCKKFDIILIADEVQVGLGRIGLPFASAIVGLNPDIITLAKPLAGGLPLSATLIPEKINKEIHIGEHGTTFGGGPVTCAVADHVLDIVLNPEFLEEVNKKSDYLRSKLNGLKSKHSGIIAVKGLGLLQGIELDSSIDSAKVITSCRDAGLLILRCGTNTLRIAPPLIISEAELDEGIEIIGKVLTEMQAAKK